VSDMEFMAWMDAVGAAIDAEVPGLDILDLPDKDYRTWADDGLSPEDAAKAALEDEGWVS
jgi:hypothetical protein